MKRLVCWCVVLNSLYIVFTVLAVLSARGQTNPFASMSMSPDGQACAMPCLFGIEPGVTTYQEAIRLLRQHPLTRQLQQIDSATTNQITVVGNGITINLHSASSGVIRDVLMFFVEDTDTLTSSLPATPLSSLALGDVAVYLHAPTRIDIATTPLRTTDHPRSFASWYYDAAGLLVTGRVLDLHMRPSTPLKHIQLSTDQTDLGEFSPVNYVGRVTISYTTIHWFGFTTLKEYMQAAIKEAGVRQLLY